MSFGKMSAFIDIIETQQTKDEEGFTTASDITVASIRAYHEQKHAAEKWINRAIFPSANALFRFRKMPAVTVTTNHFIIFSGERYNIVSVEDIKDRGRYIEVLAEKVV